MIVLKNLKKDKLFQLILKYGQSLEFGIKVKNFVFKLLVNIFVILGLNHLYGSQIIRVNMLFIPVVSMNHIY